MANGPADNFGPKAHVGPDPGPEKFFPPFGDGKQNEKVDEVQGGPKGFSDLCNAIRLGPGPIPAKVGNFGAQLDLPAS